MTKQIEVSSPKHAEHTVQSLEDSGPQGEILDPFNSPRQKLAGMIANRLGEQEFGKAGKIKVDVIDDWDAMNGGGFHFIYAVVSTVEPALFGLLSTTTPFLSVGFQASHSPRVGCQPGALLFSSTDPSLEKLIGPLSESIIRDAGGGDAMVPTGDPFFDVVKKIDKP